MPLLLVKNDRFLPLLLDLGGILDIIYRFLPLLLVKNDRFLPLLLDFFVYLPKNIEEYGILQETYRRAVA